MLMPGSSSSTIGTVVATLDLLELRARFVGRGDFEPLPPPRGLPFRPPLPRLSDVVVPAPPRGADTDAARLVFFDSSGLHTVLSAATTAHLTRGDSSHAIASSTRSTSARTPGITTEPQRSTFPRHAQTCSRTATLPRFEHVEMTALKLGHWFAHAGAGIEESIAAIAASFVVSFVPLAVVHFDCTNSRAADNVWGGGAIAYVANVQKATLISAVGQLEVPNFCSSAPNCVDRVSHGRPSGRAHTRGMHAVAAARNGRQLVSVNDDTEQPATTSHHDTTASRSARTSCESTAAPPAAPPPRESGSREPEHKTLRASSAVRIRSSCEDGDPVAAAEGLMLTLGATSTMQRRARLRHATCASISGRLRTAGSRDTGASATAAQTATEVLVAANFSSASRNEATDTAAFVLSDANTKALNVVALSRTQLATILGDVRMSECMTPEMAKKKWDPGCASAGRCTWLHSTPSTPCKTGPTCTSIELLIAISMHSQPDVAIVVRAWSSTQASSASDSAGGTATRPRPRLPEIRRSKNEHAASHSTLF
eukprot:PhM_4_TR14426/c0_g2_i1/m.24260